MEWMPAGLDGTGWALRALQMGWRPVVGRWLEQQLGRQLEQQLMWWLEHLEWMPARLDDTGWKMRTLPMGKVTLAKVERKEITPGRTRRRFMTKSNGERQRQRRVSDRRLTRRGGLRRISRSCRSFCGRASALGRQRNITAALLNISDRDPKARSKRPRDRE